MSLAARLDQLEARVESARRRHGHLTTAATDSPAERQAFREFRADFVVTVHRPAIDTPREEVRESIQRWADAQCEIVSGLRPSPGETELHPATDEEIDAEADRIMGVSDADWLALKRGRAET